MLLLLLVTLAETHANLLKINGLRSKSSEINKFDMSNNYDKLFSNRRDTVFRPNKKSK